MKSIKRFAKRFLSATLCLAMIMTTMFFFDIGITKPEAKVETSQSETMGKVAFYVPEVIYLYPSLTAWRDTTYTPFQYYIENTVNTSDIFSTPTTNTTKNKTGTIHFAAQNGYTGTPTLSYRFLDGNFSAITGDALTTATISKGSFTTTSYGGTFKINSGTSPKLVAGEHGCYVEWTLTYCDKQDNVTKSVIAYSYVYKPYTVPYGSAMRVENTDGWGATYHGFAQSTGWVVGVHSITSGDSQYYPKFQACTGDNFSYAAFLSDDSTGYNGTTALTGTKTQLESTDTFDSGARRMYAVFATTDASTSYFRANQANNGVSNKGIGSWYTDSTSNGYNIKTITYDNYSAGDNFIYMQVTAKATGHIYIDTSRYTNLNQIPNLGVGLLVTDDENTDGSSGSWYVADATGQSGLDSYATTNSGNGTTYYNYKNTVMAGQGSGYSASGNEAEGIKYAGAWVRSLTDTASQSVSKTYTAKTFYGNENDNEYQTEAAVINMTAKQQNKSVLRTAVNNAIYAMSQMAITGDYGSGYYDTSKAVWTEFVTAYKNAYKGLVLLNGDVSVQSLADTLNTKLNALLSNRDALKKGTAYQYNVGVIRNENGTYRIIPIPGATQPEVEFKLRDKVEFTKETYTGYTFLGMYKLTSKIGLDSFYNEAYDVISVPEQTHDKNRVNVGVYQNSSDKTTSFTATSTVSTSTVAAIFDDTNKKVTYPYAYDVDISYVYFYEIKEAEVIFGNDFDFDAHRWTTVNQGTKVADHLNNTVTLNSTSTATDAYTSNYDRNQKGYMTLIPGRVYEYSCKVKNNTSSASTGNMFFFTFPSEPSSDTSPGIGADRVDFTSASVSLAANGTGEVKGTLIIPEGRPYATIRLGTYTPSTSVTFSDIVVRDITDFTGDLKTENIPTKANPLYKIGLAGAKVTGFPQISKTGYQFAGWSTVRAANGNGDPANVVTETEVPANGNKTLYPCWKTNVTYKIDEDKEFYRIMVDSVDMMQISYKAENRMELVPGSTDANAIAVSNRIIQGQENWNDASVNAINYTYVPYKPGYNFNGWVAESVDPTVNGKTYWPGQAVKANANVEFTPSWKSAMEMTFIESDNMAFKTVSASNNSGNTSIYPGQVHFFSYTPTRNQYASAYTGNTAGANLMMQAYNASFSLIEENTKHTHKYGLTIKDLSEDDPMITMTLEAGKTYYAGIAMETITDYTSNSFNLTIQEHVVKYDFILDGGVFTDIPESKFVTGYSNVDTELPTQGEKHGYNFDGWKATEETPATHYQEDANGKVTVPGADNQTKLSGYYDSFVREVTLTAQWTPKPFNLIYDENIPTGENVTPTKDDVKGMPSSGTLRYNTIGYVSENTPTMPGYTFKGWATTAEKAEGEKLYQKSEEISATLATKFFDDNNGGAVTLYARWSPNLIIVRFNPSVGSTGGFEKIFYYDQPQKVDPQNIAPEKYTVKFFNSNDLVNPVDTKTADLVFDGWQDVQTGTPTYTYADGSIIKNPNGVTGKSDTEAVYTELYAKWRGGEGTTEVEVPLWFDGSVAEGENPDVLIGFAESPNATEAVYEAGERFVPTGDMNLYAVWYTPEAANDKIEDFKQYEEKVEVVKGIKYTNTDLTEYETIKDIGIPTHNVQAYLEKVQALTNASNALKNYPTAANNKAYYEALKAVEEAERPAELDPITTYLTNFKIEYADGVTGKVKEGTYSLADMNLNHYTTDVIEIAAAAAKAATDGITGMTKQSTINESVITMARAYANKQNVKIGTPTYNVYDTAKSIEESGLTSATGIEAMNYVYTGKDDYTYYCYTSSEKPVMYITVDEILADVNDRICYPTTAVTEGDIVMTRGALTENPIYTKIEDKASKDRYADYLEEGIGTAYASKYSEKAVIELRPDFTEVNDDAKNATVKYTFKAYDDAFAGLNNENPHYANSAKLASGEEKGNLEEIVRKDTTVTPENTITIIIDYHQGDELNVTSDQVNQDQWLKQFHLFRDSGGASNWELPVTGDTVYTVDDKTYGQTDYGSFTYTFEVGTENIANCVLASANVNDVIATVKAHYGEMKEVAFTGTNKEGGSGLGYKAWGSSWSFNYYPKSNAYTYVHLVDRWGNVADKVIEVPDLDAKKAEVTVQSAGQVTVIEDGGSGIGTMSLSAKTFDIITDENSIFNGESYTTSSNVIKVYTGEANKEYTLEANDVATNKATANVTTDTEGYLTITVEDKAFDTESGAYTFTLNGMEINLYAEVEKKVISATSEPVEKGQTAIVEIVTTSKVETVQLVSEIGTTTTKSEYTEDEDGNRVWTIRKNKEVGEYEYKIRFKAEGSWTTEGDKVTVTVTEPIIFVGAVTKVEYTPSTSARNDYMFTVTGRPDKIQVIEPSGGTRTYDRYHVKVVIVSYDAEGNVVGATSRELSYEVWTIVGMNVPADMELTAVAKYGKTWSKDAPYKYTVILATPEYDDEVYSMSLERTGGLLGKVKATVVTGLDVQGVRFVMEDKTTTTYYTAIAEADGKKTFVGNAWMNHGGDNIIVVKIRVNNKWYEAGELSYYAI